MYGQDRRPLCDDEMLDIIEQVVLKVLPVTTTTLGSIFQRLS